MIESVDFSVIQRVHTNSYETFVYARASVCGYDQKSRDSFIQGGLLFLAVSQPQKTHCSGASDTFQEKRCPRKVSFTW